MNRVVCWLVPQSVIQSTASYGLANDTVSDGTILVVWDRQAIRFRHCHIVIRGCCRCLRLNRVDPG